jgi:hypothetical protein
MPATAHWAHFSMQRALYDKGSVQGKQPEKRAPEKRARRFGTASGGRLGETAVVEPPGATHNGLQTFS